MEDKKLLELIERFFAASLSTEEERWLCRYLRENDVPAELRKDKEAIIALCEEPQEVSLPAGATERLEAMLDELYDGKEIFVAEKPVVNARKSIFFNIPRMVTGGAVAAAVALLVYFAFLGRETAAEGEKTSIVATTDIESFGENQYDHLEEDTFENPEDAMRCFKAAYSNVMLAVSTVQDNKKEIECALEEAFTPYKNIIKIKI